MKAFLVVALMGVTSSALATEASYSCANGTMVRAIFSAPGPKGSVQLEFAGGKRVVLPQAMSADGGRYAGHGTEFWIKGKTARLTRSSTRTECTTQ